MKQWCSLSLACFRTDWYIARYFINLVIHWQILKFVDEVEREKFKKNLDNFLVDLQIEREVHEFTEKSIFDNAQTKEERQKYLDKFFRVVCLQV